MKGLRKQYKTKGFISQPSSMKFIPDAEIIVSVTKDERGCTVSLCNEHLDLQFTVPFDEVLKDLVNV